MRNTMLAVNPEKVMALQHDPLLRRHFEKAALLIPDGIGLVLAMRWLLGLPARRVAGAELMPGICRLARDRGWRVFVYGSREAVNREAVRRLKERFPGLAAVGQTKTFPTPFLPKTAQSRFG